MRGPSVPDLDLDPERELDLRSAWQPVARRWWLPVAGLVAGAVLGLLLSVGGGETFEAKTLLYLGQPFTPNGGSQIQSLATNQATVSEIVRSQSVLKEAARASGLKARQLRGKSPPVRSHHRGKPRASFLLLSRSRCKPTAPPRLSGHQSRSQ